MRRELLSSGQAPTNAGAGAGVGARLGKASGSSGDEGGGSRVDKTVMAWVNDCSLFSSRFYSVGESVAKVQCCAEDSEGEVVCHREVRNRCLTELTVNASSDEAGDLDELGAGRAAAASGSDRPDVLATYREAREACKAHGMRLCKKSEASRCCKLEDGCGVGMAWTSTLSKDSAPYLNARLQSFARHLQHEQRLLLHSLDLEANRTEQWRLKLREVAAPDDEDSAALQVLTDIQVEQMLNQHKLLEEQYKRLAQDNAHLRRQVHAAANFAAQHVVVKPGWQRDPVYIYPGAGLPPRAPVPDEWRYRADLSYVPKYRKFFDEAKAKGLFDQLGAASSLSLPTHELGSRGSAFYPTVPLHAHRQVEPRFWEPRRPREATLEQERLVEGRPGDLDANEERWEGQEAAAEAAQQTATPELAPRDPSSVVSGGRLPDDHAEVTDETLTERELAEAVEASAHLPS